MNELAGIIVAPLALVAATIGWWLLAFVPALRELYQRSDVEPLRVVRGHDNDVHYFARRFRARVDSYLETTPASRKKPGKSPAKAAQNSIHYLLTRDDGSVSMPAFVNPKGSGVNIVLAPSSVTLPREAALLIELFAANSLHSGEANIFRAILADEDISLGKDSYVLRWLHAGGAIRADANCTLYGRASSDQLIALENGCSFEHLHAPRIEFGASGKHEQASQADLKTTPIGPKALSKAVEVTGRRWLINQDVDIPAGRHIDADIVVTGRLRVGAGCHIAGSIKGHEDIQIDHGTRIDGSVVGVGNIYLVHDCQVRGPVLSERDIYLGPGCRIGTHQHRTTMNADHLYIAPGTVAFGTVRARVMGTVRTGRAV
ncbi:MAG: hypothetical protein HY942_03640 [Gammaproteobacteria bacterium]|nr:hypothetical protein [Gammaproteobacteria bacterium]